MSNECMSLPPIRSCPFCGKSVANVGTIAEHEYMDDDSIGFAYASTHYDVVCDCNNGGCGASIGKCYDTAENAVKAWNRRADNGN